MFIFYFYNEKRKERNKIAFKTETKNNIDEFHNVVNANIYLEK